MAEGARLESVYTFTGIVGSNPTLSANLYRIENRGDGEVLISGHPEICPDPVLVSFHGSTWGTPMLKLRFIGREMNMEFSHPERGIVRTSRVREIREQDQRKVWRRDRDSNPG